MSDPPPQGASQVRHPYSDAPVEELDEPILPRWFVLLAIASAIVAVVVFLVAFPVGGGDDELPLAERRPPPDSQLTHAVGGYELGSADPQPAELGCRPMEGFAVAGTDLDRDTLQAALAAVCEGGVPEGASSALASLRDREAVVRYAAFERSGVDSAAQRDADPPVVMINVRFAESEDPRWVTPLIVHEAVMLSGDPATAITALRAHRAQVAMCRSLFDTDEYSRGCEDAEELLALDDPAAALREVGYE